MTGKEERMIARLRVIYSAERDVWVGRRGKYDPMARVERKISEAQEVLDVIDQLEREEAAAPPVPIPSADLTWRCIGVLVERWPEGSMRQAIVAACECRDAAALAKVLLPPKPAKPAPPRLLVLPTGPTTSDVSLTTIAPCPKCGGTGRVKCAEWHTATLDCFVCSNTGTIPCPTCGKEQGR